MRRKTIINAADVYRITLQEATERFLRHCKTKNLRQETLKYYAEDCKYFALHTEVRFIDEVNAEVFEQFIFQELEAGKKVASLNTRIRGLRVFFNFCAEREYMEGFKFPLLKEDSEIKEPYTDAELKKLLARPRTAFWVEWRTWAAINYLLGTGNRVSTMLNVKVCDVCFQDNTIRLTTVKNRRQQLIPLSKALSAVLRDYLKTWDSSPDDYLFPSSDGGQLSRRSFQSALARYNAKRGVSKTSAHLFRHTYAKNFIMAGGGMAQLQTLLGHSTLDMTRRYVNIYATELQKNYERLNPLDTFLKRAEDL